MSAVWLFTIFRFTFQCLPQSRNHPTPTRAETSRLLDSLIRQPCAYRSYFTLLELSQQCCHPRHL